MSADEWLAGDAGCDEYGYPVAAPIDVLAGLKAARDRMLAEFRRIAPNSVIIGPSDEDLVAHIDANAPTNTTKPAPSHWARTLRQPSHQVIGLLVR